MEDKERNKRFGKALAKELIENNEKYLWMSFCNPDNPKGSQFLGVIITKALGIAHAISKTHSLEINPGGEIMSYEINSNDINPESLDRLLSKKELEEYGYIKST